jgi:hypothetical protein
VTAQERSKKRKEAEAAEAEKAQAEGGISLVEKRARETQRDAERQLSGGRMPEDVRRFMLQVMATLLTLTLTLNTLTPTKARAGGCGRRGGAG